MSDSFREPIVIEVTELSGGVHLVVVSGEMDIATSPELVSSLSSLRGPAPYHVLVDLSRLSFIDSTGIKALVSSAKNAASQGGSLVVVAPTANIQRVFDIVQLSELLAIVPTLDAAISQAQQNSDGAAPGVEG
jgi:anti-sigma B factor antagonist